MINYPSKQICNTYVIWGMSELVNSSFCRLLSPGWLSDIWLISEKEFSSNFLLQLRCKDWFICVDFLMCGKDWNYFVSLYEVEHFGSFLHSSACLQEIGRNLIIFQSHVVEFCQRIQKLMGGINKAPSQTDWINCIFIGTKAIVRTDHNLHW